MFGFVGRVSSANQMKEALDVGTQRTRAIAARVAQASLKNGDGFALPGQLGQPESTPTGQVDIESEMVALADEQIRFEATAKMLQKTYEKIRLSIRGQ